MFVYNKLLDARGKQVRRHVRENFDSPLVTWKWYDTIVEARDQAQAR